jgi:hypothetical protein
MMAKMFYTMEEAKAALGRGEEEIKGYAREGRLREFRDGPRLMFKADQVEQLKAELSGGGMGGDQVDLGVSDSGGIINLVDSNPASGTGITLSEADTGQSSGVGMRMKDDTALAVDLGLSGSLGGVPSPGRPGGGGSGSGLSGTAAGRSGGGVNVFGPEEAERIDPAAQTSISGAVREQMNLEGVGSGSGLLDLTRESDDTSLGAVLDEIGPPPAPVPGGGRSAIVEAPGDTGAGLSVIDETPVSTRGGLSQPVYVTPLDPMAPAFGAAALAGFAALLFGVFVLLSALAGTWPEATKYFDNQPFYMFILFGMGGVLVLFVLGLIVGKMARR